MVFKLAKVKTQKFHGKIKVAVNALPTDNLFCCFIFQCLLAFALHSFLYRFIIIIVFESAISAYVPNQRRGIIQRIRLTLRLRRFRELPLGGPSPNCRSSAVPMTRKR